jgi:hypothetical protein
MKKILLSMLAVSLLIGCSEKKDDKTADGKETVVEEKKGDKKDTPPPPMPDSATMMKNWQEYMTPGDMHKMMAAWDGNWTGEMTMWMNPADPPTKSTTTAVNKMIMNGLYEESNHSGNMMGMPFSGKSTMGYDNHKKMFVSSWIDNMSSGIMNMEGPWDAATKSITLKGKTMDAGMKTVIDVRQVFKVIDDNNHSLEMYMVMPDGKETKSFEIKYIRKK